MHETNAFNTVWTIEQLYKKNNSQFNIQIQCLMYVINATSTL